jgi:hypothetical protein
MCHYSCFAFSSVLLCCVTRNPPLYTIYIITSCISLNNQLSANEAEEGPSVYTTLCFLCTDPHTVLLLAAASVSQREREREREKWSKIMFVCMHLSLFACTYTSCNPPPSWTFLSQTIRTLTHCHSPPLLLLSLFELSLTLQVRFCGGYAIAGYLPTFYETRFSGYTTQVKREKEKIVSIWSLDTLTHAIGRHTHLYIQNIIWSSSLYMNSCLENFTHIMIHTCVNMNIWIVFLHQCLRGCLWRFHELLYGRQTDHHVDRKRQRSRPCQVKKKKTHTHTYTHIHIFSNIYVCTYIYMVLICDFYKSFFVYARTLTHIHHNLVTCYIYVY